MHSLKKDLKANYKNIRETYLALDKLVDNKKRVVPASEWILDNFYIIERTFGKMLTEFKTKTVKNLKYDESALKLIKNYLAQNDNIIKEDTLISYLKENVISLNLSNTQIWHLPLIFKCAIIKEISCLCDEINKSHKAYLEAEKNKKIIKGASDTYLEHLLYITKLEGKPIELENQDEIKEREHNKNAHLQKSMGNLIGSLVFISDLDWSITYEEISPIGQILTENKESLIHKEDVETKNHYLYKIEQISKRIKKSEVEIARAIVSLISQGKTPKEKCVGYYLQNKGYEALLEKLKAKDPKKNMSVNSYLGLIFSCTALISILVYLVTKSVLGTIIAIIPVSEASILLVNYFLAKKLSPRIIPKLDFFKNPIPDSAKTFVSVTTLVTDAKSVKEHIEDIEVLYLANRDKNIVYGLLADTKESDSPEFDQSILDVAREEIEKLNKKYNTNFYFFLREKKLNEKSQKYMGWERKRGAIIELCKFLLKRGKTSIIPVGNVSELEGFKYIITLDQDTFMPKETAKKLIGAMEHPLNGPQIKGGVVVDGCALITPRLIVSLPDANKSMFSKVFAGQGGIDPYSAASQDLYQDLFGEGIFTGKGIFNIKVFLDLLDNEFPENSILSHDLLEGSYLRCNVMEDCEFIDGYPSSFLSYIARLERWTRGDWHLIPRLFKMVKRQNGEKVKNPLNRLSKWKIIDNLRRSLVIPFEFLLIILAFSPILRYTTRWLVVTCLTILLPIIIYAIEGMVRKDYTHIAQRYNATIIYGIKGLIYQFTLTVLFLPYLAYVIIVSIVKSLYRTFISGKNVLEWVTSAHSSKLNKNSILYYYEKMIISLIFSALLLLLSLADGEHFFLSLIFVISWAFSPLVAYTVSQEYKEDGYELTKTEENTLRRLAYRTWLYFDTFISEKDNFLPPDNFQEFPPNGIAHRTSPTNIGLGIASFVCARDFGFIDTNNMLYRINQTINVVCALEKWNGHLYNWYDTKTLTPLYPRYASTVDSGNLIGYLMVTKEAILEYVKKEEVDINMAVGLKTMLKENKMEIPEKLIKIIEKGKITKEEWDDLISNYDFEGYKERPKVNVPELIEKIDKLIEGMDFRPLYDEKKKLFSIGYNIDEGKLTKSYYDLLASEARQTSLIAIAKDLVPIKHWFRLGRSLTQSDGYRGLVSWTGTIFEYLMPLLIIKNYKNSLLDESCFFAVREQKKYGAKRKVPWGTSESGFYAFDQDLNYQYKAFGVPNLGLKRGLSEDMVVAPYASVMALMVDTKAAFKNILRLKRDGLVGQYGFYEAVDYTPERIPKGEKKGIVRSYMVHHQGMSLLSLTNVIYQNIFQKRFHNIPEIKSVEPLLHERIPTKVVFTKSDKEKITPLKKITRNESEFIRTQICDGHNLYVHCLSNGNFTSLITNSGEGYIKYKDIYLYRFSPLFDDSYGQKIFIRDINTGCWHHFAKEGTKSIFSPHKAEFIHQENGIETKVEICVASGENVEIRKIRLANLSGENKTVEITTYGEVTLTRLEDDLSHKAFSNLFVKTQKIDDNAVLAYRRPRIEGEKEYYGISSIISDGTFECETDRAKFIGRGRDITNPVALVQGKSLSQSAGVVLDPVLSLRTRVNLKQGESKDVYIINAIAESMEEAVMLKNKYQSIEFIESAFEASWGRARIEESYVNAKIDEIELAYNILPFITYMGITDKTQKEAAKSNRKSLEELWKLRISGDFPIITLRLSDTSQDASLKMLIKALSFLNVKGVKCDLVVICDDHTSYIQPLCDMAKEMARKSDIFGRIFVKSGKDLSAEDRTLIFSVSRLNFNGEDGLPKIDNDLIKVTRINKDFSQESKDKDLSLPQLKFDNGYGGFDTVNNEYVIKLTDGNLTPLPWSNIVANENFGFIATESGGGYTWSKNSRENKLTKWTNDPICDKPSECVFIRENFDVWQINPSYIREKGKYYIHHGFGYTTYKRHTRDIIHEMTLFVPKDEPVKLYHIKLQNTTDKPRNLKITFYIKPVMGVTRTKTLNMLSPVEIKGGIGLINGYNPESSLPIYISSNKSFSHTYDNSVFLDCSAFKEDELTQKAQDTSIMAVSCDVSLEAFGGDELVFMLGEGYGELIEKYKDIENVKKALEDVKSYWNEICGMVKVNTPSESIDIMLNGRLIYQAIASRLFGRTAFYQCGGAYGFRDQLQDVTSLLFCAPHLARKQIILHASHQFKEGDVVHWWHMSKNGVRGVRTLFSDDKLWLAYVCADYIRVTGDWSILNEKARFLESEKLKEREYERYSFICYSDEEATIYDHCILAIENTLKFGPHKLPLIGSGDWNDGMNTVGVEGKGESVWLGWFLKKTLDMFVPICKYMKDEENAKRFENLSNEIAQNIDENAWDGQWYRRAYFDDGTPLGSSENQECSIDCIAQAWSVISNGAKNGRDKIAMCALYNNLYDKEANIIKLLTPPFEKSNLRPGYIKSYVPGVRENGGQYTHAAVWAVMAFAMLNDAEIAHELYSAINPINHANTLSEANIYKVEPYVISADVYATPPHAGRGGWSWYTGAAAWFYRVGIEDLLGFKKYGDTLYITPCVPENWKEYKICYKYKNTLYNITIKRTGEAGNNKIDLIDDGATHEILITI